MFSRKTLTIVRKQVSTLLAIVCWFILISARGEAPKAKVEELRLRLDQNSKRFVDASDETRHAEVRHGPEGARWTSIGFANLPEFENQITIEVWIETDHPNMEGMQTLVSQWRPKEDFPSLSAFDAGRTDGMETGGFLGAVFDGRYVYFVPQKDAKQRHGRVLRYDTYRPFQEETAWSAYEAGNTAGLETRGYYGACFDGRYVYFTPRFDGESFHSRVLRYDTRNSFTDSNSWTARDCGFPISYQGCAFDGRFVYFCPGSHQEKGDSGLVLRLDTEAEFHDSGAWSSYDASKTDGLPASNFDGGLFDGRYVYFAPLENSAVLRYDTHSSFISPKSWSAHDVGRLGVTRCVGAAFDGKFVYFVPYGETRVITRLDTTADFDDPSSWQAYDASSTGGLRTLGFDGGAFDGRFVYFIPFWDEAGDFHCNVLRYDTQSDFLDKKSWSAFDAGNTDGLKTIGYNGGAFDGRYLYFAPWQDGTDYPNQLLGHGRVLRLDTLERGTFSLRYADQGHNGGLNAAVPGPTFIVNTDTGPRSISAHRPPDPGRHFLAGTYDGETIRLYVDGEIIGERTAPGNLIATKKEVTIGRLDGGRGFFQGTIFEVCISARAKEVEEIRERYRRKSEESD